MKAFKTQKCYKDLAIDIYDSEVPTFKPPIVAIHGMFGSSKRMDHYGRFFASHGYPLVAVNLRGHASSMAVKNLGRVSILEYIQDANSAINFAYENFGACWNSGPILLGHSMGGLIAQKVAEETPAQALILLNSAAPAGIKAINFCSLLFWVQLRYYLMYMLPNRPFKPSYWSAKRFFMNGMPRESWKAGYKKFGKESGRAALEIVKGAISVNADKINCPILVVGCENDRIVPPRIAEELYRKYRINPRAELKIFPNFAHWVQVEPGWEGPAGEILAWLNQHKSGNLK